MERKYKALLTVYGLDTMTTPEIVAMREWLKTIIKNIGKEQYAKIARFRLMK